MCPANFSMWRFVRIQEKRELSGAAPGSAYRFSSSKSGSKSSQGCVIQQSTRCQVFPSSLMHSWL